MDDLLKDAIADAKAVRETALENAKIALEEAFTPRLQSMLAKKIQSEIDVDEQDDEFEDEDEEEAPEDEAPEEFEEDDEDPSDEFSDEEPEDDMGDEEEDDGMEAEGFDESDIIEIDGVKYAPVVSEDDEDEDEDEEDEMEKSDDFDLEAVLRELEEDEAVDESKDEEVDESKEEEVDESKEEEVDESKEEEVDESKEEIDEEDIDLEEVIAALSEEENEEEATNEVAKLQSELDEHRNVVKYLRTKLNEVNLLNAKLLFTNKLFRSYGLSNDQKMKVVETFDRAHNLREVKLVYSTLAESFGSKPKTEIKESKGSASKAVASTKSEKQEVIAEGHEMRDRFKKLAGIL
jgi:uncharacterized protein YjdB